MMMNEEMIIRDWRKEQQIVKGIWEDRSQVWE
jgi:hypothetical protein